VIDFGAHRLLVLAPHPDDEVIGCGGLIAKVKDQGGEVHVKFMTVGDTRDASEQGFSSAVERDVEVARVAALLGFDGWEIVLRGSEFHLRLDDAPQARLIEAIEHSGVTSIQAVEPTLVAVPDPTSYNQDHRAVAQAALSALRPGDQRLRPQPQGVLVYEQVADQWNTGSHATPNLGVELGPDHLAAKLEAMRTYKSQLRDHPSTRSVEALEAMAVVRGTQFGCPHAEAFRVLRWRV
jgi:N-acetylglucosamine malate deacetylase 1